MAATAVPATTGAARPSAAAGAATLAPEAPGPALPATQFLEAHKKGGWAKKGPGFVREVRQGAVARLKEAGFPTTRDEGWRQTSVKPILNQAWTAGTAPARALTEAEVAPFRIPGAIEVVFVDGHHVPALDRGERPPRGIKATPLSQALLQPSEELEMHLARHADNDHPFVALNAAFLQDGCFVHASPGALLDMPVHLLHVSTGPAEPTASHLRHLVLAEAGSDVTVIETYAGLSTGLASLTTAVTEVVAASNSRVRRIKLQRENLHAFHVGVCAIREDRDAQVQDLLVSVGAALSRSEVAATLGSPGAEVHLDGLFLGTGRQHVDCPTSIDHAVPHTTSRELYKGIVDGHAHGVFVGAVKVRADAQKTSSEQTNRNLLLSANALVDTTPQLEIDADDVKCSHGSTIGQLSKDALFFLRSRGLGEEAARLLLTQAFAHEVIAKAPESLQPTLDGLLAQWFACRKVAGVPLE